MLLQAVARTRADRPFVIHAWVVLPDHLHCVRDASLMRHGFSPALESDQCAFLARYPCNAKAQRRTCVARRTGNLATPLLGTPDPRSGQLQRPHGRYMHINPLKHGLSTRSLTGRARLFIASCAAASTRRIGRAATPPCRSFLVEGQHAAQFALLIDALQVAPEYADCVVRGANSSPPDAGVVSGGRPRR